MPSSLSPTITKLRYQDRGSSDARFGSSLAGDRCQRGHQERRARANGEELEKYHSWYWPAQGWTMKTTALEKTVKTGPANQPLCKPPPHLHGMAGSVGGKSPPADRNTPAQRERERTRVHRCRESGMAAGGLPGLQWAGAVVFQGLQRARRAPPGLSTLWLGCSRR